PTPSRLQAVTRSSSGHKPTSARDRSAGAGRAMARIDEPRVEIGLRQYSRTAARNLLPSAAERRTVPMKPSHERILTTHGGSIPRRGIVRVFLRGRLQGRAIDEAELTTRVGEAVRDVVRRQAEVGLDVVSDGEMSKTSFLAYTDDRLTGFVTSTAPADP